MEQAATETRNDLLLNAVDKEYATVYWPLPYDEAVAPPRGQFLESCREAAEERLDVVFKSPQKRKKFIDVDGSLNSDKIVDFASQMVADAFLSVIDSIGNRERTQIRPSGIIGGVCHDEYLKITNGICEEAVKKIKDLQFKLNLKSFPRTYPDEQNLENWDD